MNKPAKRRHCWHWTAIVLAGCGSQTDRQPGEPEPLRVAVASDLQAALPALASGFKQVGGIEVVFTVGSSGNLARQVRQGAPFDLFLAANRQFVADLAKDGTIRPDSLHDYGRGSLVLAVHQPSGALVQTLADLARPEIKRVALANPAFAPYGAAGKQALERAGLWEAVEPKIARAESVRQALQFVQSGNAEAGLVGLAIAKEGGVRVIAIDPTLYDPIIQGVGVVARTRQPGEAERFLRFLIGEAGQRILIGHGFAPVSGSGPDSTQP